jgi:UPF0716 protein FxsA
MSGSTGLSMRRRVPWWVLALLFVVLPVVEIYVLIQIGQAIGAWWTVLLLIADGVFGSWLMKREGTRAWAALTTALRSGRMPARELADAALILVGGTLLLTPGFVSDIVGLFLILPFTRPVARRILTAFLTRRFLSGVGGPGGVGGLGGFGAGLGGSGTHPGGPGSRGDSRAGARQSPGPDGVVQGEVVD